MDFYYVDPTRSGEPDYGSEPITRRIYAGNGWPTDVTMPRASWMYLDWLVKEQDYKESWFVDALEDYPDQERNEILTEMIHQQYVHRCLREAKQPEWIADNDFDYSSLTEDIIQKLMNEPLIEELSREELAVRLSSPIKPLSVNILLTRKIELRGVIPWQAKPKNKKPA